ncbi:MAG: SDR family NAD(P)-dependent oxidoreductase [Bernardetiaceae bacterium]
MKPHVLITGAAGNLGQAVVRRFLDEQWHVTAFTDPRHPEQVEQLQSLGCLDVMPVDVGDAAAVRAIAQRSEMPLHALVPIVGGFAMGDLTSTSPEAIQEQIHLNFFTAYHCVQAYWQRLRNSEQGKVILIGSRTALYPRTGGGVLAYTLAKSLLVGLCQTINGSRQGNDPQAALVVPSIIDTPQNRSAMPEEDFSRWVSPADIAQVIFSAACPGPLRHQQYEVYGEA